MEQTQSGLLVPDGTVLKSREMDAGKALERYYEGMAKLERNFPALVKMAIQVAGFIENYSHAKGISPNGVLLDVARWQHNGIVTVAVELNPEAVRDITNDVAAKNFSTLKEVNETYPQAVELAMSLAFQLVGVINNKKLLPAQIGCGRLIWNAENSLISFKMTANGQHLAPPMTVRI